VVNTDGLVLRGECALHLRIIVFWLVRHDTLGGMYMCASYTGDIKRTTMKTTVGADSARTLAAGGAGVVFT